MRIGGAPDREIEAFAIQVENDDDPARRERYRTLPVLVGEEELEPNTSRVLDRALGEIRAGGAIARTRWPARIERETEATPARSAGPGQRPPRGWLPIVPHLALTIGLEIVFTIGAPVLYVLAVVAIAEALDLDGLVESGPGEAGVGLLFLIGLLASGAGGNLLVKGLLLPRFPASCTRCRGRTYHCMERRQYAYRCSACRNLHVTPVSRGKSR